MKTNSNFYLSTKIFELMNVSAHPCDILGLWLAVEFFLCVEVKICPFSNAVLITKILASIFIAQYYLLQGNQNENVNHIV